MSFVLAALEVGTVVPVVTAAAAVAGLIFASLRYNREDASAVVEQQNTVFQNLKDYAAELQTELARIRLERDALLLRSDADAARIAALNAQIAALTATEQELLARLAMLSTS